MIPSNSKMQPKKKDEKIQLPPSPISTLSLLPSPQSFPPSPVYCIGPSVRKKKKNTELADLYRYIHPPTPSIHISPTSLPSARR